MNAEDKKLREQLVSHINGGMAFMPIEKFINKIPFEKLGIKPEGLPYSFYQQFYHITFAQKDILDFSKDSNYKAPEWPQDYWKQKSAPANEAEWEELKKSYFSERDAFCKMIKDPSIDLYEAFPHGSGQNLFREALLVVEHTAYHTGQLLIIARLLNVIKS